MRIVVPASHGGTGIPGENDFPWDNTNGPGNIWGHGGNSYLNGIGSLSRALPFLSVRVDAELLDRGLGDHGRLATPQ